MTYSGSVRIDNSNDGRYDSIAMPVTVTVTGIRVTDYEFSASLRCTDGSFMNVGINYAQLSSAPIPLNGGGLSVLVGSATQGDGLTAQITGKAVGKHMSGTLQVQAHEDSGITPSGPLCTSTYHWSAAAHGPAQLPKPTKAKPFVRMTVDPVALPVAAASYSYGLAVGNVVCGDGATAFRVSTAGRGLTLTCAATVRRPLTKAVMGLSAGRTYHASIQAIKVHGKRSTAGLSQSLAVRIPPPSSPDWHTIPSR